MKHYGMCDASAAVPLNDTQFIVANDEDNFLRVYQADQPGKFTKKIDVSEQIKNSPNGDEADIEGAALIGEIIYWITSHGRNNKGKLRPARHNFFANKISVVNDEIFYTPVGSSYTDLIAAMQNDPKLQAYELDESAKIAPKNKCGLNIEGLTATPDGHLLIGFRNPIPHGKALLVPLLNPADVVRGEASNFGNPVELELGGLGIRSIEYWPAKSTYLIVAGSYKQGSDFKLYQWSGQPDEDPKYVNNSALSGLNPEVIIIYPHANNKIQILSDDGTLTQGGEKCKDFENDDHKYFRSTWVTIL